MGITIRNFGEIKGASVYAYTLLGKGGLSAEILTLGGIIRKLEYRGVDVVLGRDTLEEYLQNEGYFGALIGRNSNRIAGAAFTLGETEYRLARNDGTNNLHGGIEGFDKKIWDAEIVSEDEPSLLLSLVSPDGEEGFPGTANIRVLYSIKDDNRIEIRYTGECDKDTVLNMTNHSYFNLNGHASGPVYGHSLCLNSDFYTPNTDECIPTGEVLSVTNTPFDFTEETTLGERLSSAHAQIQKFGGFDHNFALRGRGYREVGSFTGDKTGITMKMYTDQSGLQIYSGNMIEQNRICKDGAVYQTHGAVCFETQAFPNSLAHSHFPGAILKKGERYETVTAYKFI